MTRGSFAGAPAGVGKATSAPRVGGAGIAKGGITSRSGRGAKAGELGDSWGSGGALGAGDGLGAGSGTGNASAASAIWVDHLPCRRRLAGLGSGFLGQCRHDSDHTQEQRNPKGKSQEVLPRGHFRGVSRGHGFEAGENPRILVRKPLRSQRSYFQTPDLAPRAIQQGPRWLASALASLFTPRHQPRFAGSCRKLRRLCERLRPHLPQPPWP